MERQLLLAIISFILVLTPFLNSCDSTEEEAAFSGRELMITTSPIEIDWQLISNFEPDNKFSAIITFRNTGSDPFEPQGWVLYFNSIRPLDLDSFSPWFNATHINGDFFKLEPTEDFEAIASGEEWVFPYKGMFHAIKFTDAPQGFYFVYDDGSIENVETINIAPFTTVEQINRSEADRLPVPDAEFTFNRNEIFSLLNPENVGRIIPTPRNITEGEGFFHLQDGVDIYFNVQFLNEADFLSSRLLDQFEIRASTHLQSGDESGAGIYLNLEPAVESGSEGYRLVISSDEIRITSADAAGIFYGIQSLLALISNRDADELLIPALVIEDSPAFVYRGMHLDVSRNFLSIDDVKLLLDLMATYKLNKFHFHLTDDEGWRLEIDALPELTMVGGRRGHTEHEKNYLIPAYGSGPDPTPGNSFGSGWYTRAQYIEILQYANERHIEVIPEIDVPGHARAAIVAMKSREERLKTAGDHAGANYYRLDEEGDMSDYRSIQNFDDNVINVCQESTYRFMEVVIDEIVEMHILAGAPLQSVHVGGDEVPQGVWEQSPACRKLMEEEGIENVRDLQVYFFDRLLAKLQDRSLSMAGWEEVVFREDPDTGEHIPNPRFAGPVHPHVWSNIWGSGTEHYAYTLANMGYKVIMSHASNFYFDFAYNKHWEEPGFYWASMFDTIEPYSFIPFNLYRNAVRDNFGNPIPENQYENETILSVQGRENILGLQGQLWTETVNRPAAMEYMVMPRLLGLAERAWVGDADWSEIQNRDRMWTQRDIAWNEFANRIGQFEFKRLDDLYPGLNYRLPAPGAVIQNGQLHANTLYPGLEIRYLTDSDTVLPDSPIYTGPVDLNGSSSVSLATFNSLGRSSRIVTILAE
jgi:hexosaminidase